MKNGILGSGDVGRRLVGETIKIGSRNPNQDKITEWMANHDKAKVSSGTFAEAASFGELDLISLVNLYTYPILLTILMTKDNSKFFVENWFLGFACFIRREADIPA
jgi:hypothetical protein